VGETCEEGVEQELRQVGELSRKLDTGDGDEQPQLRPGDL
jgi:hypothetical protein